ncbi:hypothetical protein [Breoghania sp.]|uniref:hypothetical protein n=1 Tax=Breoghania sp. TaxID=2065378 RepID=UPI002AA7F704|nr:hypothetical protein [Breoghania sp.]
MFKAILKGSFQLCLSNFDTLIKAAGTWTVILIVGGLAKYVLWVAGQPHADGSMMRPALDAYNILSWLMPLLGIVAASSIAVAWHRFALLGETPATFHVRFGKSEFRYTLYNQLFLLCVYAISSAIFFLFLRLVAILTDGGNLESTAAFARLGIALILSFLFMVPIWARVSLMLPAAAVDEPMGPLRAYRFAKGMGWAMTFANLCLVFPLILLAWIIRGIEKIIGSGSPQAFGEILTLLVIGLEWIIPAILALSVSTVAYALARRRHEATAEPIDPAA